MSMGTTCSEEDCLSVESIVKSGILTPCCNGLNMGIRQSCICSLGSLETIYFDLNNSNTA